MEIDHGDDALDAGWRRRAPAQARTPPRRRFGRPGHGAILSHGGRSRHPRPRQVEIGSRARPAPVDTVGIVLRMGPKARRRYAAGVRRARHSILATWSVRTRSSWSRSSDVRGPGKPRGLDAARRPWVLEWGRVHSATRSSTAPT